MSQILQQRVSAFCFASLTAIIIILLVRWPLPKTQTQPLPVNVDAVVTLNTQSDTIYLIDGAGVQVGSMTFGDEITVTLKRKK